jgi:hypothetical protein
LPFPTNAPDIGCRHTEQFKRFVVCSTRKTTRSFYCPNKSLVGLEIATAHPKRMRIFFSIEFGGVFGRLALQS